MAAVEINEPVTVELLKTFAEAGQNVMLEAWHGVGKTSMMLQAFEELGWNVKYFSAATMDPWVDFIGIPKDMKDEDGDPYLGFIPPKDFAAKSQINALIIDEFNRAKEKVTNAVMELIQFKTINGVKYPNLKVVWIAINPDDDDAAMSYNVNEMDDAIDDRFHIRIRLPYDVSENYFEERFNEDVAAGACEWWRSLSEDQQKLCSPRRLQYALDGYFKHSLDLRYYLDGSKLPLEQLRQKVRVGSYAEVLEELYQNGTDDKIRRRFNNINFQTSVLDAVFASELYTAKFLPFITREHISKAIGGSNADVRRRIMDHGDFQVVEGVASQIRASGGVSQAIMTDIVKRAGERGMDIVGPSEFDIKLTEAHDAVFDDSDSKEAKRTRHRSMLAIASDFNFQCEPRIYRKSLKVLSKLILITDPIAFESKTAWQKQICTTMVQKITRAVQQQGFADDIDDLFDQCVETEAWFQSLGEARCTKLKEVYKALVAG